MTTNTAIHTHDIRELEISLISVMENNVISFAAAIHRDEFSVALALVTAETLPETEALAYLQEELDLTYEDILENMLLTWLNSEADQREKMVDAPDRLD